MKYTYRTRGTCSQQISLEIKDGRVYNVNFLGGCDGNLQAVSRLVEGLSCEEVISRCQGIRCGYKNTSCADQLANAICQALPEAAGEQA